MEKPMSENANKVLRAMVQIWADGAKNFAPEMPLDRKVDALIELIEKRMAHFIQEGEGDDAKFRLELTDLGRALLPHINLR